MSILQIEVRCPKCLKSLAPHVSAKKQVLFCPTCGQLVFKLRPMKGTLYIMKNEKQQGVKIGITTKDPEIRARQLASTGVIGKFEITAIFSSFNPKRDELRIQEKLERKRIDKEHYLLDPAHAVARIASILGKEPVEINSSVEEEYRFIREQNREQANKRLRYRTENGQVRFSF